MPQKKRPVGHQGRPVSLYLPHDQIKIIDRLAYDERVNRSTIVQRILEPALKRRLRKMADLDSE